MGDPYNLDRFVEAQRESYDRALAELRAGRKASHWMWFIFPQIQGLGMSAMSRAYAISSLDEARAYLAHPVLGPRLLACSEAAKTAGGTARQLFGSPDDMKFRSCMTLFGKASPETPVFREALERFFGGERDPRTLEALRGG